MRRLPRRLRSALASLPLIALLATTVPAPATPVRAAEPDGGTLRAAAAERRPEVTDRGAIDVGARLDRGAPGSAASGSSSIGPIEAPPVQTADTTGQPPIATTTTAPDDAVGLPFPGLTVDHTSGGPADPWLAVGPEHIVQVIDTAILVQDRAAHVPVIADLGSADLFDLPDGWGSGYPRVLFDSARSRWLMSQLSWTCDGDADGTSDDPVGSVDLLVSQTADPLGLWDLAWIQWDGYLPHEPAVGTSTDKIAIGSDLLSMAPTADCVADLEAAGTDVTVVDWASLLDTQAAELPIDSLTFGAGGEELDYRAPRVAVQTPAASPVLHVVVEHLGAGLTTIEYAKIGGTVDAGLTVGWDDDLNQTGLLLYSVAPPAPKQPGGTSVMDDLDSRPTQAVWMGGRLTWVATVGCVPTGDSAPRACVRVSQLSVSETLGAAPTLRQDFVIADLGVHHYAGGIGFTLDGTLVATWTRSRNSAGGQPTAMTAYQRPSDPLRSLSPRRTVLNGAGGPMTSGTWAHATAVAQDPQVPNSVWMGGPAAAGGGDWTTVLTQRQTAGASYEPITPLRLVDTRIGRGISSRLAANTPRSFQVAGATVGGRTIPGEAVAITANVTVTSQSAAGYVSLTTSPTSSPRSSTSNFPRGDTRANNVTIPLSATGRLSLVYKATSGATTHAIVDVTGYFVAGSSGAEYQVLGPTRILDSRVGWPDSSAEPLSFSPRRLQIAGVEGIPADAEAITANLTVIRPTGPGYVSVTPTRQTNPATSTINVPARDTRANGLTARLSDGGLWLVFRSTNGDTEDTHVVLDVTGYYRQDPDGLAFYPLTPGRLMDTRGAPFSALTGRFVSGTPRAMEAAGHWGIPVDAKAVTGNLTVTGQTAGGYVGFQRFLNEPPATSAINVPAGDTRANGLTTPLTLLGGLNPRFDSAAGATTHLILDVTGYFR